MNFLKRVVNIKKEILFQNPDTGIFYRRVAGAVGWPWEPRPGFMVVIGERFAFDQGLQGRPLEVLAEREVDSITALHQGGLEMRKLWACDLWLADLGQEEAVRLFMKMNRNLGLDRQHPLAEPIRLRRAPYNQGKDRLQTLFHLLGTVQSPERKLLSYGPESKLPGYAMGLDQKDLQKPTVQFPPLAALGYAVAELILREPWSETIRSPQVVTAWDIYA
jgi:hypothetical protein